jgi:GntR family transcriptional repressor for pyruvate dehydrogenase complex
MFPRVTREPRLSDKVAELLLETILGPGLRPGDRLPSERELGEQFGVSRTVIREAVRALAAKGVIDVRTGSGLRVAAVDATAASESIGLYLRGSSLDYGKVHEVRKLLEIEIAGLAAARASVSHLARLRENCDAMARTIPEDVEEAARLDLEFHREIARATGNELYLLLLDSIGVALLQIRQDNLQAGAGAETIRAHRKILERIAASDPDGARKAMARHLAHVEKVWKARARAASGGDSA